MTSLTRNALHPRFSIPPLHSHGPYRAYRQFLLQPRSLATKSTPKHSTKPPRMSWMDSWSRPSKSQATPPPLYLTAGDTVPYCHSCGRVISQRRTQTSQEVKYCSARCRHSKPGALDRKIESVFASLLDGASPESLRDPPSDGEELVVKKEDSGGKEREKKGKKKKKAVKGDPRVIVECGTVESVVFPREQDPNKVFGRRKNRAPRGIVEKPEDWRSVDMVDDPTPAQTSNSVSRPPPPGSVHSASTHEADTTASEKATTDSEDEEAGGVAVETPRAPDLPDQVSYGYGGGKVRPPQEQNDINGGVGGEKGWAERIEETDEMKAKRREGQRRADEREMVRRAARRGVAFGFAGGDGEENRKCEAVMKGLIVEASFAKGEWGIRWREKV